MTPRHFGFQAVAGRAEKLARKVLSDWLAGGLPEAISERELDKAIREEGAGEWTLFEGRWRRTPRIPREARALEFLQELTGARARVRGGDADQAARVAFLAAMALGLLLDEITGRPRRRKVLDPAALVATVARYRRAGRSAAEAKIDAGLEFGVDSRTVERYLRK